MYQASPFEQLFHRVYGRGVFQSSSWMGSSAQHAIVIAEVTTFFCLGVLFAALGYWYGVGYGAILFFANSVLWFVFIRLGFSLITRLLIHGFLFTVIAFVLEKYEHPW